MSAETTLATVRGSRETVGAFLDAAVLWPSDGEPYFPETLVRVDADGLENPVGAASASPVSYCTFDARRFVSLEVGNDRIEAVLDAPRVAGALEWVDGDPVEIRFRGPTDETLASAVVVVGASLSARVPCPRSEATRDRVTVDAPSWFADGEFVRDEVRTTIRTTPDALEPVVTAVERVGGDTYPLAVADDTLRAAVRADGRAFRGELAGAVSGDDIEARYGDGFATVVRALDGPLELQITADGTLAVVADRRERTLRYVLAPVG